jgi:hypothetical protein
MGFWNKLGKMVLTAAPYVAAPFTGGTSLLATGLTNKAVQKWSESDAKKAVAKGLAPSKFDSVLGKVGGAASLATSFMPGGALGKLGMLGKGSTAAKGVSGVANAVQGGSKIGKVLSTAAKVAPLAGAGIAALRNRGDSDSDSRTTGIGPTTNPTATTRGGAMPKGGFRYSENPMNQYDQSSPNLATSIFQGRQEAIRNQPFRKGYDIKTLTGYEDDDVTKPTYSISRMPRITSDRPDLKPRRKKQEEESSDTGPVVRRGGKSRERVPAY